MRGLIAPEVEPNAQTAQPVGQPALTDRPVSLYDANFDLQLRRSALGLADELRSVAAQSDVLQAERMRLYANELIENIVLEGRNAG